MLLSNHRNSVVFKEGLEGHLKLIGSLYDQSQDCLVQMLEFLDLSQNLDEMASLPAFDALLGNYGLSPDAAFSLSRIKFQRQINLKFEEMKQEERAKTEDGKLADRVSIGSIERISREAEEQLNISTIVEWALLKELFSNIHCYLTCHNFKKYNQEKFQQQMVCN